MKKEYRAELKQLRKAEGKLDRDLTKRLAELTRARKALEREADRAYRNVERERGLVEKRIRILEGRLN